MKLKYSLSMAVALLAVSSMAYAAQPSQNDAWQKDWYVFGSIGSSMPRDTDVSLGGTNGSFNLESALVAQAAIGKQFNQLRLEGEVGYRKSDVGNGNLGGAALTGAGDVAVMTYMLNGYYDIPTDFILQPYLSAGIGLAHITVSDPGPSIITNDSDNVLAYQLGAGVNYPISQSINLIAGYRYLATEDGKFTTSVPSIPFTGTSNASYSTHEVSAGLRFNF